MTDEPQPLTDSASIEDNYTEYLDDEFGYVYGFADALTQQESARHHALRIADTDALEALENAGLEHLPNLDLLAIAHAFQRHGNLAHAIIAAELLLAAADADPRINYPEVSRHVADLHLRRRHIARAQAQLQAHLSTWPDDLQAQQLNAVCEFIAALVTPAESQTDPPKSPGLNALHDFTARFAQDAELRLEIAEDLARFGLLDAALDWLAEARALAKLHDPATLVDVELLAARLTPTDDSPP